MPTPPQTATALLAATLSWHCNLAAGQRSQMLPWDLSDAGLEGQQFLMENAKKDGVIVLPSGLQYKQLRSGHGRSPSSSDLCSCHYEGSFLNGTVFDTSLRSGESTAGATPAIFATDQVMPAWSEALQLMREGDRWRLFVPSSLAYGRAGAGEGRIAPDTVLLFDLELLEVKSRTRHAVVGVRKLLTNPLPLLAIVAFCLVVLYIWAQVMFREGSGRDKVTVRHILVADEALALDLKARLLAVQKGKLEPLFGQLAKEHSTCFSGRDAGGSLGSVVHGQLGAVFDSVIWNTPLGEVRGPVQTKSGYHLVLVTRRRSSSSPEAPAAPAGEAQEPKKDK